MKLRLRKRFLSMRRIYYSLWVNAERIDLDKGSLRAYLAAIARNKAKNKLREHKTQTLLIQETDQVEVTDFCLGLEKEERQGYDQRYGI